MDVSIFVKLNFLGGFSSNHLVQIYKKEKQASFHTGMRFLSLIQLYFYSHFCIRNKISALLFIILVQLTGCVIEQETTFLMKDIVFFIHIWWFTPRHMRCQQVQFRVWYTRTLFVLQLSSLINSSQTELWRDMKHLKTGQTCWSQEPFFCRTTLTQKPFYTFNEVKILKCRMWIPSDC